MEQLGTGLLDDDIVLQDGATSLTHQKWEPIDHIFIGCS
jgi:hypothetical protein